MFWVINLEYRMSPLASKRIGQHQMCRVQTETNNLGTSKWYYCQWCQICLEKILRVGNTAFASFE